MCNKLRHILEDLKIVEQSFYCQFKDNKDTVYTRAEVSE